MQIKDLHYNDRITAFEALVCVKHANGALRIPCRVPGHMNLDPDIIRTQLMRQAVKKAPSR